MATMTWPTRIGREAGAARWVATYVTLFEDRNPGVVAGTLSATHAPSDQLRPTHAGALASPDAAPPTTERDGIVIPLYSKHFHTALLFVWSFCA